MKIRLAAIAGSLGIVLVPLVSLAACPANSTTLCNPLNPAFSSIPALIEGVLKAIAIIAIPVIAFFFILAGFKFLTAQGETHEIQAAKRMFVNVVIGAALILGAWALAQIIGTTINQVVT